LVRDFVSPRCKLCLIQRSDVRGHCSTMRPLGLYNRFRDCHGQRLSSFWK
jgi:hypothetical protein